MPSDALTPERIADDAMTKATLDATLDWMKRDELVALMEDWRKLAEENAQVCAERDALYGEVKARDSENATLRANLEVTERNYAELQDWVEGHCRDELVKEVVRLRDQLRNAGLEPTNQEYLDAAVDAQRRTDRYAKDIVRLDEENATLRGRITEQQQLIDDLGATVDAERDALASMFPCCSVTAASPNPLTCEEWNAKFLKNGSGLCTNCTFVAAIRARTTAPAPHSLANNRVASGDLRPDASEEF